MSDGLKRGLASGCGIRITLVDVTETAKELERRHLSGPVAGQLLAQSLAAAALLSGDAATPDECVSLQFKVNGPVEGILAEAAGSGALRGFTYEKVLNELDGNELYDLSAALGSDGGLTVIRSTPKATLNTGHVRTRPPCIARNLAKYYNESMQTPTAVELVVASRDGYLTQALGCTAEKMPDGDTEAFVRVLEAFHDGRVAAVLSNGLPDAARLAGVLDVPAVEFRESRPLRFACRCSEERASSSLGSLSAEELKDAIASGKPEQITCHFCGQTYTVGVGAMQELLRKKLAAN